MIQRMTGPRATSASALEREVGVPQPTLSTWLRQARRLSAMGKDLKENAEKGQPRSPKSWTADEKLKVVMEAAAIPEDELGAFLRSRGLHAAQLEEWRRLILEALAKGKNAGNARGSKEAKRVRELEKDLRRKEKALAEVTALLTLKKKLEMLWGDAGDDTPTRNAT